MFQAANAETPVAPQPEEPVSGEEKPHVTSEPKSADKEADGGEESSKEGTETPVASQPASEGQGEEKPTVPTVTEQELRAQVMDFLINITTSDNVASHHSYSHEDWETLFGVKTEIRPEKDQFLKGLTISPSGAVIANEIEGFIGIVASNHPLSLDELTERV